MNETMFKNYSKTSKIQNRDIKFVQIIGVFEFTGVTCRPLLTFWVQTKVDKCKLKYSTAAYTVGYVQHFNLLHVHDFCQLLKQFIERNY